MARWGMVIDLRKCIGCRACTIVCRQTNQVPLNVWRWVVDGGISKYPERQRLFLPMSCMHCSQPPCLEVCPTTATYRRPDGIVDIYEDLCVGCGYCIVACPYMARTIISHNVFDPGVDTILHESDTADLTLDRMGICTKCTFCLPRVDAGLAQGLTPGLDPDASPSCVISCSASALHFGDLDDPDSVVSRLIRDNKTARLQEELGTDSSVYYIVEQHPSEVQEATKKMELIQPIRQKAWGWPAVVNFVLGGMASGFYWLSLLLAIIQDGIPGVSQPLLFKLLAPALVILGFLTLTVEAGRPVRGRHLLRHLRRSWMSRETLAGAIFIPAAIVDWFFPHPIFWGLAAVAAIGLLISQGFIMYRARAVTAWNLPLMPLLFLTSGFATGGGLALLLAGLGKLALGRGPVVAGLMCVILNLAVWLLYLCRSHDAAFNEATKALRRPRALISIVGIGHLLPVVLLLLLAIPGIDIGAKLWHIVATLAGLTIISGGVSQKAGVILKAGYLRGIGLGSPKDEVQGRGLIPHPVQRIPLGARAISVDLAQTGDVPE